jgi:hypothetical protein
MPGEARPRPYGRGSMPSSLRRSAQSPQSIQATCASCGLFGRCRACPPFDSQPAWSVARGFIPRDFLTRGISGGFRGFRGTQFIADTALWASTPAAYASGGNKDRTGRRQGAAVARIVRVVARACPPLAGSHAPAAYVVSAPNGATGCSHGWSGAAALRPDAQPVESGFSHPLFAPAGRRRFWGR